MGLEFLPDIAADVRDQTAFAGFRVLHPDAEFKIDTVIGERRDQRLRLRIGEHARLRARGFNDQAHRSIEITVIADLHRYRDAHIFIGIGVVDYGRGDHELVRYQNLSAVELAHHDIARGQARDLTGVIVDRHEVANRHRTVEQDDEAADVVAGDFLQAKADA